MTLIVAQHCNALAAAQWLDFKSPCCCTTLAKLARKDFRLYRLSHFAPYIMCGVGTVASSHLMGLAKTDGALCTEIFATKKLLQDHKKKEKHIRPPKNKKPSGRKSKSKSKKKT